MLDTVTAKQFDEWVAYRQLEPNKMDRQRVILTRGLQFLCNSWGGKLEQKDIDPYHEPPEPETVTPLEAARRMRASFGG